MPHKMLGEFCGSLKDYTGVFSSFSSLTTSRISTFVLTIYKHLHLPFKNYSLVKQSTSICLRLNTFKSSRSL